MILLDVKRGASAPNPWTATFLTSCTYNICQVLLLWYLPLYLLLIVADDCIEDFKTGYKNVLIAEFGRKSYFGKNILKGFLIAFAVVFVSLIINLAMTQIVFAKGSYLSYDTTALNEITNIKAALEHPAITNIVYIAVGSFVSGIVGAGAVGIAIALRNRLIVYPVVFAMWYVPSSVFKNSVILALQPFTEYAITDALPALLFVVGINIAAVIFAYIKELKYEDF